MTTTTKNPARKSAGLRSVTVMADSVDYGSEMEKLQRIWDELVRDVRDSAYELPPLRRSALEEYQLDAASYDSFEDTPLFAAALREFGAR